MVYYDVVVLGSCMVDLVCCAPRLPQKGETLHGTKFFIGNGGKGANQCVAAAKLGAVTALVARLGDDSFGKDYLRSLKETGVNVDNVVLTPHVSSGMAQITVADNGDNNIVIVPGANNELCIDDVLKASEALLNARVITFQFEVPLETTVDALKFIKLSDSKEKPFTIVNGAPARKDVDPELFKLCDCFCVNEVEASTIIGKEITNVQDASGAVATILDLGCAVAIVTLGGDGVVFASQGSPVEFVPVDPVTPVDTTGAGDAFVGSFAYFTARYPRMGLSERVLRACKVATMSVLSRGTQSSFPTRDQLPESLFSCE